MAYFRTLPDLTFQCKRRSGYEITEAHHQHPCQSRSQSPRYPCPADKGNAGSGNEIASGLWERDCIRAKKHAQSFCRCVVYMRLGFNSPFSRGGHVKSQENKSFCFCPSKLVFKFFTARLDGQNPEGGVNSTVRAYPMIFAIVTSRSVKRGILLGFRKWRRRRCWMLELQTNFFHNLDPIRSIWRSSLHLPCWPYVTAYVHLGLFLEPLLPR